MLDFGGLFWILDWDVEVAKLKPLALSHLSLLVWMSRCWYFKRKRVLRGSPFRGWVFTVSWMRSWDVRAVNLKAPFSSFFESRGRRASSV